MSNITALPFNTNVAFMYDGKLRQGVIESRKGSCVVVKTDDGYRSFNPNKVQHLHVIKITSLGG